MRLRRVCFVFAAVCAIGGGLTTTGAHAQRSSSVAALVLQSQSPWVGAGETFQIRIATPPPQRVAPNDLEYAISVHPSSPSRNAFAATLTTRATTAPLAVITTPVSEATTDETGAVTLYVGVQDPTLPRDRTRVGLRGAGVYPLAVELRTVGGAVHARLLTHLIFVPTPPTGPRLAVGVIVPVRAPIALQPDGVDRLAARDVTAITNAARTLATLPTPGVLLAPAPETLAALQRGERPTEEALVALRALGGSHTIIPSPFVAAHSSATPEADSVASRARGRALISSAFGAAAFTDVVVVENEGDDRLVGDLPKRLVVTENVLQPATLRFTTAEPILVRRASSRTVTAPALLADKGLAAHLTNRASPVLAAHHVLADLATVYFDSPGRFRSIVVLPPETWRVNAAVLSPLIAGLASSPILEAAAPDRLFMLATKRTTPKTRVLQAPPTSSSLPDNFASLRRTIASLRTVMADAPAALQSLDNRLLIAQSAVLNSSERRRYVAGLTAALTEERRKFQLPTGGSLTLTARRGAIPITVRSSAAYPARVLLQVASDRLKFPGGSTRMIRLSRHDTTERFNVQSLGSGAFPLRILLKSPDGKVLLSQTRLTVRSTNASGVGIALSVGAGAFLLGWWYRHSSRRRRTLAAGNE
jgi:hypothetical protein